jgi:hypothetical protein
MSAHHALASRAIIDKLTPLLPKDSEEVNLQVRQLEAMLDASMMTDPTLNPRRREARSGPRPSPKPTWGLGQ